MATDTSMRDQPNTKEQHPNVQGQRPDADDDGKDSINVGVGILLIIGATGLWLVLVVVLFHYLTDRLLGR